MKPISVFFLFAVLIFLGNLGLIHFEVNLPIWITSYLNDLLCMPIVLWICLKAVHIIKRDNGIHLDLLTIFSITIFYAVYFEWYLPLVEPRYTADWMDVIMYFSGAFIFYYMQFRDTFEIKKAPGRGAFEIIKIIVLNPDNPSFSSIHHCTFFPHTCYHGHGKE